MSSTTSLHSMSVTHGKCSWPPSFTNLPIYQGTSYYQGTTRAGQHAVADAAVVRGIWPQEPAAWVTRVVSAPVAQRTAVVHDEAAARLDERLPHARKPNPPLPLLHGGAPVARRAVTRSWASDGRAPVARRAVTRSWASDGRAPVARAMVVRRPAISTRCWPGRPIERIGLPRPQAGCAALTRSRAASSATVPHRSRPAATRPRGSGQPNRSLAGTPRLEPRRSLECLPSGTSPRRAPFRGHRERECGANAACAACVTAGRPGGESSRQASDDEPPRQASDDEPPRQASDGEPPRRAPVGGVGRQGANYRRGVTEPALLQGSKAR